jgi:hypothetical protein
MSSKLTLYIDDDVIQYIKNYAKEQKLSVSKVVNNFLILLIKDKKEQKEISTPITNSLQGVLKASSSDREIYHKHMEEKYL